MKHTELVSHCSCKSVPVTFLAVSLAMLGHAVQTSYFQTLWHEKNFRLGLWQSGCCHPFTLSKKYD